MWDPVTNTYTTSCSVLYSYERLNIKSEAMMKVIAAQAEQIMKMKMLMCMPKLVYTSQPAAYYIEQVQMRDAVIKTLTNELIAEREQTQKLKKQLSNSWLDRLDACSTYILKLRHNC